MASLNGVDSIGVSRVVIQVVQECREWHEDRTDDPTSASERCWLTLNMVVSQRDAEYIVECLRVLLQQESIAQRTKLSLDNGGISDEAIDVFGGFLRETRCHLHSLWLWNLPYQQVRRLLEALHTNRSVKELIVYTLQEIEGALWIAELLRHKTDFQVLSLNDCRFSFTQILPWLCGQLKLQELGFIGCCINSNGILLFHDPEFTQLFVDNILLSSSTTLKKLWVVNCGVAIHKRPLMAGIHNNTTLVELTIDYEDAATRLFIDPILRRNVYLGHVHEMLGARALTLPSAGVGEIVVPTIPPPCGLWATVLAKVGQGTQGASPVFLILRDRLATWMIPPSSQQVLQHENQNNHVPEEEEEEESVHDVREESLLLTPSPASNIAAAQLVGARPPGLENGAVPANISLLGAARTCPSGDEDCGSINVMTLSTSTTSTSIGQKRGAPTTISDKTAGIKMPKSDVL